MTLLEQAIAAADKAVPHIITRKGRQIWTKALLRHIAEHPNLEMSQAAWRKMEEGASARDTVSAALMTIVEEK